MKAKRGFITAEVISLSDYTFKINTPLFLKEGIDFDISFYEGILKENPYLVECLRFLGNAYTAKGMYNEGLEIDKTLSKLRPDDPEVFYNLACSYSLTQEIDSAIFTLKKAIDLGYNDVVHMESDSDIDNLRNDKRYKTLVRYLKFNIFF